jgi:hypothetical protein
MPNPERACEPLLGNADGKWIGFILFAIKQAKEAETFGFKRNIYCRNLKTALHEYWQHKTVGLHSLSQKAKIPRSKAARNRPLSECVVEHVVPQMVIVNHLMEMKQLTKLAVIKILKSWYHVRLVTREEHKRLTELKLRYKMTPDWDGLDIFARYAVAGIKVTQTGQSKT